MSLTFNLHFDFKRENYMYIYKYTYLDYVQNIYILEPKLIENRYFIVSLFKKLDKNKIEKFYLTQILYFVNYVDFCKHLEIELNNYLAKNLALKKENLSFELYIWRFKELCDKRAYINKINLISNLLEKQNKSIWKIIDLKYTFVYDKITLDRLKSDLDVELRVLKSLINQIYKFHNSLDEPMDDKKKERCVQHLRNLILGWRGFNTDAFEKWIYSTIGKYTKQEMKPLILKDLEKDWE